MKFINKKVILNPRSGFNGKQACFCDFPMLAARFNISLKPGKYRFQTWFYSDDAPEGDVIERGAYYVYIKL